MKQTEGTFSGVGGRELYYQSWQPAGEIRAALAIIHGIGEHSGRYMNLVNHLVPQGYVLYGFDHRGHGRSPGRRGHINAWSEFRGDVRAFLQMIGEQPCFLLGHSMGGLVALDYGLHYPDGLPGLIASSPPLGQLDVSPILIALSRIMSRIWPAFSLKTGLDVGAISRDPAVVKAYQEDPQVHGLASARLGAELFRMAEQTQARAAGFSVPLLMIHGSADRITSPEASRAFFEQVTLADKKYITYEGGYHESFNDIHHQQADNDLEIWLEAHL